MEGAATARNGAAANFGSASSEAASKGRTCGLELCRLADVGATKEGTAFEREWQGSFRRRAQGRASLDG